MLTYTHTYNTHAGHAGQTNKHQVITSYSYHTQAYIIFTYPITMVRSTFNKSLMVSTGCLHLHLLAASLRHQELPCARTYHYQMALQAIICRTRLPMGLLLLCYLAVARANPHPRQCRCLAAPPGLGAPSMRPAAKTHRPASRWAWCPWRPWCGVVPPALAAKGGAPAPALDPGDCSGGKLAMPAGLTTAAAAAGKTHQWSK